MGGELREKRVLILGAGGRDFHNFNVFFRGRSEYRVVAFTMSSQVPGEVAGRRYPPELAGPGYPEGIPVVDESEAERIIREEGVDVVVLSYSDLDYQEVGHLMSMALASGASFVVLGPRDTMLRSSRPVIAVTAVRTGAGKSTVSRRIAGILAGKGFKVAPVRHPMVYRDLKPELAVQVYRSLEDLDRYEVTIEEREEYEAYLRMGLTVYAGIDYGAVLRVVEREADVILWDGGNNDWPFFRPDFMITVADALRPGQEVSAFPGEVNVRMADAVIVNKIDRASQADVKRVVENVKRVNPRATISLARSVVEVSEPEMVKGRRVVIVEDSPTVTHGGARYGAGLVAAEQLDAEVVDPRPYARGVIREMYERFPHMGPVVPSTGYTPRQLRDLEETLNAVDADVVLNASPIDLSRVLRLNKPVVQVRYTIEVVEGPTIEELVEEFLRRVKHKLPGRR